MRFRKKVVGLSFCLPPEKVQREGDNYVVKVPTQAHVLEGLAVVPSLSASGRWDIVDTKIGAKILSGFPTRGAAMEAARHMVRKARKMGLNWATVHLADGDTYEKFAKIVRSIADFYEVQLAKKE